MDQRESLAVTWRMCVQCVCVCACACECMRVCVHCVCACVRAHVRVLCVCVRACMRVLCVCVCVCVVHTLSMLYVQCILSAVGNSLW